MNFSFSEGPTGPVSTIIHLQFCQTSNHQDPSSSEGRLWASFLADVSSDQAWKFTLCGRPQKDDGRKIVLIIGPCKASLHGLTMSTSN